MQYLEPAAVVGVQTPPVDVSTTTAGIAAAEAWFRGTSRHAEAVWQYLQAVQIIEDDDARDGVSRIFGSAFRMAYAARLVKLSLCKDHGRHAAKMAFCRLRAAVRRIIAELGDCWWKKIRGPGDVLAFGTQTRADRAAARRRTSGIELQELRGVLTSLLKIHDDPEIELVFKTGGAEHRWKAQYQAARALLGKSGRR
jgi:hypothetical protein